MTHLSPKEVSQWLNSMASIIPGNTLHTIGQKIVQDRIDGRAFNSIITTFRLLELGCDNLSNLHANRIRKVWRQDFPQAYADAQAMVDADGCGPGAGPPPPSRQGGLDTREPQMQQHPPSRQNMHPGQRDMQYADREQLPPSRQGSYAGDHYGSPPPQREEMENRVPSYGGGYGGTQQMYPPQTTSHGFQDYGTTVPMMGRSLGDAQQMEAIVSQQEDSRRDISRLQGDSSRVQSDFNRMQTTIQHLENAARNPVQDDRVLKRFDILEQRCSALERRYEQAMQRSKEAERRAEDAEIRLQKAIADRMEEREHDVRTIINRIGDAQHMDKRLLEQALGDLFVRNPVGPNSQGYAPSLGSGAPMHMTPGHMPHYGGPNQGMMEDMDYGPMDRGSDRPLDVNRPWNDDGGGQMASPMTPKEDNYGGYMSEMGGYMDDGRGEFEGAPPKGNSLQYSPVNKYNQNNQHFGLSPEEFIDDYRSDKGSLHVEEIPASTNGKRSAGRALGDIKSAGSQAVIQKSPAELSQWVRGLPESILPEKTRITVAGNIEAKRINGEGFYNIIENGGLAAIGCQSPLQQSKIVKAWKNVIAEEDAKLAVISQHRENQKTAKKEAVKMIV